MTRSRLLSLSGSIAIHMLALAAVVWLFRSERIESVLFIDLTEPIRVGGTDAATEVRAGSPADARPGGDATARPRRRSEATRSPRAPARPVEATKPAKPPAPNAIAARETRVEERTDSPRPVESTAAARATPPIETVTREITSPATSAWRASAPSNVVTLPDVSRVGVRDDEGKDTGDAGKSKTDGGVENGRATGESGSGRGGGRGATGDGTAIARTTPGAGDGPDLGPYHKAIWRHVRDSLEYPPVVRRRGLKGTVEVDISFGTDGGIRNVTLARSSSDATLDRAAIEALKQLPPLAFPPGLPPLALRVRLPVEFDLR